LAASWIDSCFLSIYFCVFCPCVFPLLDFSALIPAETSCRKWTFSNCYKSVSRQLVSKGLSHRRGYGIRSTDPYTISQTILLWLLACVKWQPYITGHDCGSGALEQEQTLHNGTEVAGYLGTHPTLRSPWMYTPAPCIPHGYELHLRNVSFANVIATWQQVMSFDTPPSPCCSWKTPPHMLPFSEHPTYGQTT